ncbi:KAP family P-loop NTPase fold protein [Rhodomicrobium vannielii]|uniref:KAP family P-loop NTPase fold protein n=1 Tax=Rhodomicrobium vannielii TaxID=1069 RepID=UPI00031CE2EE|nr:P-loop NTPase fold protein [Rhodomicrobium vannielii]
MLRLLCESYVCVSALAALDEVLSRLTGKKRKAWADAKSQGLKIVGAIGRASLKAGLNIVVQENVAEGFKEALKAEGDKLIDTFSNSIAEFRNSKDAIESFKEKLGTLFENGVPEKLPLIILVDELDRCRPTYAVQLLERVKHLFDMPNVAFVLATNTHQLSHSVNAVYGSSFDGSGYLHRFFDSTYTFSLPKLDKLVQEIAVRECINYNKMEAPASQEEAFIISAFEHFHVAPRDIERCMELLKTLSSVWPSHNPIQLLYAIPLIIAHQTKTELFDALTGVKNWGEDLKWEFQTNWPIIFPRDMHRRRAEEKADVKYLINQLVAGLEKSVDTDWDEEQLPQSKVWLRRCLLADQNVNGRGYRLRDYPRLIQQAGRITSS